MNNFLLKFCLLFALLLCSFSAKAADIKDSKALPEMHIECVMAQQNCYERQPVSVVITLFSTSPDVVNARVLQNVELNKGEFATYQTVKPAGSPYTQVKDNKKYYCFPLDAFIFTMPEKGKYSLQNGKYRIGVQVPSIVNDPFWGKIRVMKTEETILDVEKKSLTVKTLPAPPANIHFSGSVGEFSIETILPHGDIYVNEPATAIVVLKGTGMIADSTMPVYLDAFTENISLKSVQESRTAAYDHGRLVSELHLECTFTPSAKDGVKIGEIYFDYFDAAQGKYVRAKSKPVVVNVKSSVSKRKHIEI